MKECHAIRAAAEPGPLLRDVIGHNHLKVLFAALPCRLGHDILGFGGESDFAHTLNRPENIRMARQVKDTRHLGLLQFLRGTLRRPPVRNRRRRNQDGVRRTLRRTFDSRQHIPRRDNIYALDTLRCPQRDRTRHKNNLVAPSRSGPRHGKPHPPRGRIREEPHRVNVFSRRTSRDDECHLVFRLPRSMEPKTAKAKSGW